MNSTTRDFWAQAESDLSALIDRIEKTRPRPSLEDLASRGHFIAARETCRGVLARFDALGADQTPQQP